MLLAFLGAVMLVLVEPKLDGVTAFSASIATLPTQDLFSLRGVIQIYYMVYRFP